MVVVVVVVVGGGGGVAVVVVRKDSLWVYSGDGFIVVEVATV